MANKNSNLAHRGRPCALKSFRRCRNKALFLTASVPPSFNHGLRNREFVDSGENLQRIFMEHEGRLPRNIRKQNIQKDIPTVNTVDEGETAHLHTYRYRNYARQEPRLNYLWNCRPTQPPKQFMSTRAQKNHSNLFDIRRERWIFQRRADVLSPPCISIYRWLRNARPYRKYKFTRRTTNLGHRWIIHRQLYFIRNRSAPRLYGGPVILAEMGDVINFYELTKYVLYPVRLYVPMKKWISSSEYKRTFLSF